MGNSSRRARALYMRKHTRAPAREPRSQRVFVRRPPLSLDRHGFRKRGHLSRDQCASLHCCQCSRCTQCSHCAGFGRLYGRRDGGERAAKACQQGRTRRLTPEGERYRLRGQVRSPSGSARAMGGGSYLGRRRTKRRRRSSTRPWNQAHNALRRRVNRRGPASA
jgi:hypothetical protein